MIRANGILLSLLPTHSKPGRPENENLIFLPIMHLRIQGDNLPE